MKFLSNWDRLTIKSLERQLKENPASRQKDSYSNRLVAFTMNSKNTKPYGESIRYKFLSQVRVEKRSYYIIESNMSGDALLIRNFVVYIDSGNNAQIDIYAFVDEKWHKYKSVIVDHFELKEKLASYNNCKKGYNHDDIIISKIVNDKVIESEFYLTGALLSSSPFKRVIEAYYI